MLTLSALFGVREWRKAAAANADIAALLSGHDIALERWAVASPAVQLARAVYFVRHERYGDALELLNRLETRGDASFRADVYYNQGNLQLIQALDRVETAEIDQARVYAELAKEAYRHALLLAPGHWDAKYNLEVAMRLMPEMDRVSSADDEPPRDESKRLWTNLPGFPRGLP
ncbi:MxaK protein [Methylococcus capsulatus]|nr:MxaK protein [Methylococcus sp. BF19-07]MDF9391475.1 MxaK protein [Methylococcus capsulatus]